MADRFPSLDEIDAGQTEARGDTNFDLVGDNTDGDDFLSRERAALGDDANQFATPGDNLGATVEDDDDDLLGGGDSYQPSGNAEAMSFENDFPAIDTSNDHMAPGGTITGTSMPFLPGAPTTTSSYIPQSDEPEPEAIRQWREDRDRRIQIKDEEMAVKKSKTIENATKAMDMMFQKIEHQQQKTIDHARAEATQFLEKREDTTAGGTSWERIAKLVDLSGKGARGGGSGTEKQIFRELLLSLRKDEKAPGASGY